MWLSWSGLHYSNTVLIALPSLTLHCTTLEVVLFKALTPTPLPLRHTVWWVSPSGLCLALPEPLYKYIQLMFVFLRYIQYCNACKTATLVLMYRSGANIYVHEHIHVHVHPCISLSHFLYSLVFILVTAGQWMEHQDMPWSRCAKCNTIYMYMHMYMYIMSCVYFMHSISVVVEGDSCGDRCDSGAHPQRAHSQWQSLKCTKGVQNISGSTCIVHVHACTNTTVKPVGLNREVVFLMQCSQRPLTCWKYMYIHVSYCYLEL